MSRAIPALMAFLGGRGAALGIYASLLVTQLRFTHFDVAHLEPTHVAAAHRSSTLIG
jgi:hypothetical protein